MNSVAESDLNALQELAASQGENYKLQLHDIEFWRNKFMIKNFNKYITKLNQILRDCI